MIYKIFLTLKKVFRSVQNLGILIGNTSTLNYFRPKEILMRISKTAIAVSVLSLFAAAMVPATSMAAGGASGAAVCHFFRIHYYLLLFYTHNFF